mmetsp:Transcript_13491/g.25322  ORF Transcript_13491/g.25322 Transcript_13491/m.25322 type:complete len:692 (+) Transcript_13491:736-2811(+)
MNVGSYTATSAGNNNLKRSSKTGSISGDLFHPPTASVEIHANQQGANLCEVSSIGSVPLSSTPMVPVSGGGGLNTPANTSVGKLMRSPNIRILVLGPPTNLPHDFSLYQQFNLELMCSGPHMARALMEWVADCDARRIQEVEKAAMYQKSILLEEDDSQQIAKFKKIGQASTLTHVEGAELGKELRKIMLKKESFERNGQNPSNSVSTSGGNHGGDCVSATDHSLQCDSFVATTVKDSLSTIGKQQASASQQNNSVPLVPFKGIEDAAKASRTREKAAAKVAAHTTGEDDDVDDDDDDDNNREEVEKDQKEAVDNAFSDNEETLERRDVDTPPLDLDDSAVISAVSSATVRNAASKVANSAMKKGVVPAFARRKIKWHALVDSGMGRLGFKSVEDEDESDEDDNDHHVPLDKLPGPLQAHTRKNAKWMVGPHRDTVSIIKAMTEAEVYGGAPIEFYGMCTHMAEASSDSDYTNEQMTRFKSLLKRVRQAGIAVPTISTDNSAALLTMNLNHFNPMEILVQKNVTNSLGYVRTGGGIFGQRPAFPQLRSVSTLTASVRHVAILQAGSSVGYDRAYIAPSNVRIATLTIGFADGYPRDLGNGRGKVSIRGALFPIAGNVCMDMLMVDLGPAEDVESIGAQVCVGDRAVLWGPEQDDDTEGQIRLQDLAQTLKTTQSALTCGLNKSRVQRHYVE